VRWDWHPSIGALASVKVGGRVYRNCHARLVRWRSSPAYILVPVPLDNLQTAELNSQSLLAALQKAIADQTAKQSPTKPSRKRSRDEEASDSDESVSLKYKQEEADLARRRRAAAAAARGRPDLGTPEFYKLPKEEQERRWIEYSEMRDRAAKAEKCRRDAWIAADRAKRMARANAQPVIG